MGVRRLALHAAARTGDADLVGLVADQVSEKGVLGAARSALAGAGDAVLPVLSARFDATNRSDLRRGIVAALGRMRGEAVTAFLVSKLDVGDIAVRQDVVRALARLRYTAASPEDRERIEGLARREARRAIDTLSQARDLEGVEEAEI